MMGITKENVVMIFNTPSKFITPIFTVTKMIATTINTTAKNNPNAFFNSSLDTGFAGFSPMGPKKRFPVNKITKP